MFISAPENIFIQLLYKTHLLHHQIIQKVDICLLRAWKYCCLQLYLLACVLSGHQNAGGVPQITCTILQTVAMRGGHLSP